MQRPPSSEAFPIKTSGTYRNAHWQALSPTAGLIDCLTFGRDHSPHVPINVLIEPVLRVAEVAVLKLGISGKVLPGQRIPEPYIHVRHGPAAADLHKNIPRCHLGVQYLSKGTGEPRQNYLKIVFVDHRRSQVGMSVAALIVGDLQGSAD